MNYSQQDFDDELNCRLCKKRFDIPKMMPCAEHICATCETNIYDKTKPTFDCPLCKEQHTTPSNELPVSGHMQRLLKFQTDKIYRGEKYKESQEQLYLLQKAMNSLQEKHQNSEAFIINHCNFLRNDVEIVTESQIALLLKFRDELLTQIDEYETKCLKNIDKTNQEYKCFVEFIEEAKAKFAEWMNYLKGFNINDAEIERITKNAIDLNKKFKIKDKRLDFYIFNEKLGFGKKNVKNIKVEHVGRLIHSPQLTVTETVDKPPSNSVHYSKFGQNVTKLMVTTLKNDQSAIAYEFYSNNGYTSINVLIVSSSFAVIKSENIIQINSSYYNYNNYNYNNQRNYQSGLNYLTSNSSDIIIAYSDSYEGYNYLKLLDENLNEKSSSSNLSYQVFAIATDDKYVYVNARNGQQPLFVYDLNNLTELSSLNQVWQCVSTNDPFYFPLKIQFKISGEFIYALINTTTINKLAKETGEKLETFSVKPVSCFEIISDAYLVIITTHPNELVVYDLDGNYLESKVIDNIHSVSSFSIDESLDVIINSSAQQTVYLFNVSRKNQVENNSKDIKSTQKNDVEERIGLLHNADAYKLAILTYDSD